MASFARLATSRTQLSAFTSHSTPRGSSLFHPGRKSSPLRRYRRCAPAYAERRSFEPDPLLDEPCPVPRDQQPMQEFKALKETFLFDWADLPLPQFVFRLGCVWGAFLLTLGLPVSVLTFDISKQPVECFVAASAGSLVLVTFVVLRLFLGFNHVGTRLLSATVVYEETGWYDGQVWVKTPQMLMRDRLLGIYTVKPALQRLKYSLYSLAGGMALSLLFLAVSPSSDAQVAPAGSSSSSSSSPGVPAATVRDYWDAVREYEPWALEEGERDDVARGHSLLSTAPRGGV